MTVMGFMRKLRAFEKVHNRCAPAARRQNVEQVAGALITKVRRGARDHVKGIPTEALMHELERRQFTDQKVQHRWVCDKCGNEAISGRAWETSYVLAGRVWCKVCDPHRPDFYGTRGPQSVPMRQTTEGRP